MRLRTSFACVLILMGLVIAATAAQAAYEQVDQYYWPPGDDYVLLVEEDATYEPDGGWYYWSYTIKNLSWDQEGVVGWGYNVPKCVSFEYCDKPTGWVCGYGMYSIGWSKTDTGDPIAYGETLDHMKIRSKAPPHNIYEGCAESDAANTVSGEVSGPTPEPISMALLALGLPAGLLMRRRRDD